MLLKGLKIAYYFVLSSRTIGSIVVDSNLHSKSSIKRFSMVSNSSVGAHSYIGRFSKVNNTTIGKYCSIGREFLSGLGDHPSDRVSTSPLFYKNDNFCKRNNIQRITYDEYSPISIGNDVWIGSRVIVLDGVSIGDGAIVAAGAVVTTNVAPYTIVGGVPAKVIKRRETSLKLIEDGNLEKWWDNFD